MTVVTLPYIPGLIWVHGDGFAVHEHGLILHPDDAFEFLAELLACALVAQEPQAQVVASLRGGEWHIQILAGFGELPDAAFERALRRLLTGTLTRPVL